TDEMLRPEKQDLEICIEGMETIIATHQRVAQHYFNDESIDLACPPLKALLHIMRDNAYEGKDLRSPEIRALFTRESLLSSPWYEAYLAAKQERDIALWERHVAYLEEFLKKPSYAAEAARLGIPHRLAQARATLECVRSAAYLAAFRAGELATV